MTERRGRTEGTQVLQTTAASLQLVDEILELGGASLSQLVEATGLAKSTVHSHLRTLSEYGYVVNEDNRYHLGAKFCHLGDYVRTGKEYHRIAEEVIAGLAEESTMEVDFAVEEHGRVVSLYGNLDFSNIPRFLIDGSPFHVHTTASGKAIVAQYDEERVRAIIDRWGLPAATERSITTEEELFEELARVRERGYAENRGEAIEGFWAIGKAVMSPRGEVYGSLNLSGPEYLVDDEVRATQADLLSRAVETFEREVEQLYRPASDATEE
ncbi:ArcR family transcriptional regulator [Salinigranum rubrum]|uniref:ArcR family transcriptional regulator n=1 Tax=Salinigranum rubrum TaxID=755307 RepID=A0A2I8VEP2_9EURY|nr:IclR family transcriptional regulator C-terminal domain-containing protein [Salinigranum rubrum]AUV80344.1 ArcR family transcriptional regulator [Salinigranum rubrum]